MKKSLTILLATLFIFSFVFIGCGGEDDDKNPVNEPNETVKIGVLQSLTGGLMERGIKRVEAIELAVEEINNYSGVFDREIELIIKDTETNADVAVVKAGELIDEGVVAIIGANASSATIAVANGVTIPAGMTLISPGSASPAVTDLVDNNTVFRTVPSGAFEGMKAAQIAATDSGYTNAAVVHIDGAYGNGLSDAFVDEFESLGGTISANIAYPEMTETEIENYDFSQYMVELFGGTPEIIYIVSYGPDGSAVVGAMQDYLDTVDLTPPLFFGCQGNRLDALLVGEEAILEGMLGLQPTVPADSENYQKFVTNYTAKYGYAPDELTETAYDAVYLLAYSILISEENFDVADIAANLTNASEIGDVINVDEYDKGWAYITGGHDINYEGASGNIDFDENGDITNYTYELWTVESGDFVTKMIITTGE